MTPPPENFSARGSSSSFSPFTLKCPNSSFLETNFENFLQRHSAQHSLQRVLSSYRQLSFHLPLPIYMAKISDLETPEQNFLPRRRSSCTFSQTPLTPTWEKSRQSDTTSRKSFSARESSSNVQNRAFWKPLSKIFFQIASHEYQQPSITHANPAGIASCQRLHIARCPSMQKSRQSGNHFWKLFNRLIAFNIVFRGYCLHTGSILPVCPSISTWRKSAILETPEQKILPA